ncbi:hypothetical protein ACLOJK_029377 [Asimina triloba]
MLHRFYPDNYTSASIVATINANRRARLTATTRLRRSIDTTAVDARCTTSGTPKIRPKHVVDIGITVA